ncbi:hypothetical protein H0E87_008962, partial [Populus deltoides]
MSFRKNITYNRGEKSESENDVGSIRESDRRETHLQRRKLSNAKQRNRKEKEEKKKPVVDTVEDAAPVAENLESDAGEIIYTIDAAKKMKYEELFPVETKKFGYSEKKDLKSVEDALDDRVKKKADRY